MTTDGIHETINHLIDEDGDNSNLKNGDTNDKNKSNSY